MRVTIKRGRPAGARTSLRAQLSRTLCLIGVLPILAITLFAHGMWYRYALDLARLNVNNALRQADDSLNNLLQQAEDIALGMVINPDFRRMVSNPGLPTDFALRESVYNEINSILLTNARIISAIHMETPETLVFTQMNYTNAHSVFQLSVYGTPFEDIALDMRSNTYWLDAADIFSPDAYTFTGDAANIRCITAVPRNNRNGFCGILSLMLRVSALKGVVSELYAELPGARAFLLDRNGQLIAGSDSVGEEVIAAALAAERPDGSYTPVAGKDGRMEIYGLQNERTGWRIISAIPTLALTAGILRNAYISLCVCLVLALACVFAAFRITRGLVGSFSPLMRTMRAIEGGDWDARAPETGVQEAALIGSVFNHMMNRYNDQVRRNAMQQSALLRAQFEALQGQLSSHFLYNTLDAINWSLVERGAYDISASVAKLGELLRYCLHSGDDTVPLREEVGAVRSYLEICKLRFEERLTFSIDVDARFQDALVPRFLLQPIIENSVVHGCENNAGPVEIALRGFEEGAFLVLEVFNSGSEFPQDVMDSLHRRHELPLRRRAHIGLSNIVDRLRILYGDAYTLTIRNLPGRGTTVRVLLPRPEPKEGA